MAQALVAALVLVSTAVHAQTSPATPSSGASAPVASDTAATSREDAEAIRREVDAKVEAAKKEIREELRAQLATQSAAQGWQEEWTEEKRKLELFVPNGYFRVRPDLFNKFDLSRGVDSSGYSLFPHTSGERTIDGVNMRFRFEPTLNVSEEVRIKTQVDLLNNLQWGSTPDYAYSRSDRTQLGGLLSEGQVPPQAGQNAAINSILVRRVWGEVSTPVGILRAGRMGSHWGLGMLHNDGNCLDCDYGETVDRAQFVIEPIAGYFITPMFDVNSSGLVAGNFGQMGQPYNLTNSDDAYSYVLVLARRDTETQAKSKLENNLAVFNYGLHFTYRYQKYETLPTNANGQNTFTETNPYDPGAVVGPRQFRDGSVYMPDLWVKYERKRYRLEFEGALVMGSANINNPMDDTQSVALAVREFGATGQAEIRFLDGALHVGLESGVASGHNRPGLGNHPERTPLPGYSRSGVGTVPGDIDGPQICLPTASGVAPACGAQDTTLRNFRFSRDYRIDLILWREILGGITDAFYAKPSIAYTVADGLAFNLAAIYSRALRPNSAPGSFPGNTASALGLELNAGIHYETDDGFFTDLKYGILFPFSGLRPDPSNPNSANVTLDIAQAVRANIGIRF